MAELCEKHTVVSPADVTIVVAPEEAASGQLEPAKAAAAAQILDTYGVLCLEGAIVEGIEECRGAVMQEFDRVIARVHQVTRGDRAQKLRFAEVWAVEGKG